LKGVDRLLSPFGNNAKYVKLWLYVIEQAKKDLDHPRKEIQEDARSFLCNTEDTGLNNLLQMLGMDYIHVKERLKGIYRKRLR
jgi:hypothetical protein